MINAAISFLDERKFALLNQLQLPLKNFWSTFHSLPYFVQREWRHAVMNTSSPSSFKRGYAQSIRVESKGDAKYVVYAEGEAVDAVEKGIPAYDMKPGLLNGPKARRSAKGTIFNIVPFRHNVTELKAAGIYSDVNKLDKVYNKILGKAETVISKRYRVVGYRSDENAFGKMIKRAMYSGNPARFDASDMPTRPGHASSIFHGIVKTGDTRHTGYMSFRVVSQVSNPSKWIHPGYKANPVFSKVRNRVESLMKQKVAAALRKDIQELKGRDIFKEL